MLMFRLTDTTIAPEELRARLQAPDCGAFVSFEGWIRNHNEGKSVRSLEYTAYAALAEKEGARIVAEAIQKFGVSQALCEHRIGHLTIGDLAVWVGVASSHRGDAFSACRYIIDEIKARVPIWKREHYAEGEPEWVACHHPH